MWMCSQADLIFFFFVFVFSSFIMLCSGVVVLGIYPARGSRRFLKCVDMCHHVWRIMLLWPSVFSPFGTPVAQMLDCQLCLMCVFSALSISLFSLLVRMLYIELSSIEFINPFVFSNLLLIYWIIRFSYFSVLVNFLIAVSSQVKVSIPSSVFHTFFSILLGPFVVVTVQSACWLQCVAPMGLFLLFFLFIFS